MTDEEIKTQLRNFVKGMVDDGSDDFEEIEEELIREGKVDYNRMVEEVRIGERNGYTVEQQLEISKKLIQKS